LPAVQGRKLAIFALLAAMLGGCGSSESAPTPKEVRAERIARAETLQDQSDAWTKRGEAAEADLEDAIWKEDRPAELKAEAEMRLSLKKVRAIKDQLEALVAVERRRLRDERTAAR
jgi:uncharacterized protein YceK